tara:strand:- start:35 stop:367 length:333 start_codon:yes stop_codon:yes gene_type:complete
MSSLINNLKTIPSCRAKKQLDSGVVEENNKIMDNYKKNLIPLNENKFFNSQFGIFFDLHHFLQNKSYYQGLKHRHDLQSTSQIYKSKVNDMTSNKNNYKIIKRSFFKDYF